MSVWNLISQIRERVREEEGTLYKQASLRVALCYPSAYSIGMSSLGYQTMYREMHLHRGAAAERAFLPEDTEEYRKSRTAVFTCETEMPRSDFPVVAFAVSYELALPRFLVLLFYSRIAERT